jgi:hypothetical protein
MNRLRKASGLAMAAIAIAGISDAGRVHAAPLPSVVAPFLQPPPGAKALALTQATAAAAIAPRLASLQATVAIISTSTTVLPADKTALLATLNADRSGLTALGAKIRADTTGGQATADYRAIFYTYRVFALAVPQAEYVSAADAITGSALPTIIDVQGELESLLNGPGAAKNSASVQAAMDDLQAQISAVQVATAGLTATVLAYRTGDYSNNNNLLTPWRLQLANARADLKAAIADLTTVETALR